MFISDIGFTKQDQSDTPYNLAYCNLENQL